MKNIFGIFKRDINNLVRNPVALIIMIGLIIIPSLYAWFNIAANWDPYSNTKNIAIAVVNEDKGTNVEGKSINAGKEVTNALKENHAMDWTFVKKDEALEGVKSGEFYAAVIVPESFSSDMASILTGVITKPTLEYYLNEKTNAIANKMTNVGVDTVQTQVDQAFIAAVTQVVGSVLNVSVDKLNQADPIDSLMESLREMNTSLEDFKRTVSAIQNASSATKGLLEAVRTTLPDAAKLLSDGENVANDTQSVINSGRTVSARMNTSLEAIADMIRSQSEGVTGELQRLAAATGEDANAIATDLEAVKNAANKIIEVGNKLIALLNNLKTELPKLSAQLDTVISGLQGVVTQEQNLVTRIDEAIKTIRSTGQIPGDILGELAATSAQTDTLLSSVVSLFKTTVSPALDTEINAVYNGLGDLSRLLTTAGSALSGVDASLSSVNSAIDYSNVALGDISTIIGKSQEKIEGIITNLGSIKSDARWGELMNIMRIDPDTAASFVSSPVQLKTTAFYPVANYGAAMTPFYTTLCLWVGALVLVAIIKTNVKNQEAFVNLKHWEVYFGRYLIFLVAAILQGLVASLGDLYLLRVEMVSPGLFILASLWTSIVYSLFIYTLTCAFDEVGKAIAVLIMVIQVAGSGGTFPIQVLPEFFQRLNPFMAFTYSIGAMREAVAGQYGNYFAMDMFKLSAYVVVALLIGLVLRKPLIRLNEFFKARLEDTEFM